MGYLTESQAFDPAENIQDSTNTEPHKSLLKKQNCYYSDIVGEYIKDAITGAKYPWKVGSKDEIRFFRVICTTTLIDSTRKGTYDNYMGRSSRKAFYEDPYAYMSHRKIDLDENIIKNWYEKMNNMFPGQYTYVGVN